MESATGVKIEVMRVDIKEGNLRREQILREVHYFNQSFIRFFPWGRGYSMKPADNQKIVVRNTTEIGRAFRDEDEALGLALSRLLKKSSREKLRETCLFTDNLIEYPSRAWHEVLRHELGHIVFFKMTKTFRYDRPESPSVPGEVAMAEEVFAEWIKIVTDNKGDVVSVNKSLAGNFLTSPTTEDLDEQVLLFESIKQGYYGEIKDLRARDAAILNYVYRFYGANEDAMSIIKELIRYYNACFLSHNVKKPVFKALRKFFGGRPEINTKRKEIIARDLQLRYENFQERMQFQLGVNLEELSENAKNWYQTGITTGNWEIKTPNGKPPGEEGQK